MVVGPRICPFGERSHTELMNRTAYQVKLRVSPIETACTSGKQSVRTTSNKTDRPGDGGRTTTKVALKPTRRSDQDDHSRSASSRLDNRHAAREECQAVRAAIAGQGPALRPLVTTATRGRRSRWPLSRAPIQHRLSAREGEPATRAVIEGDCERPTFPRLCARCNLRSGARGGAPCSRSFVQ